MKVHDTGLGGVRLVEPQVFGDDRGSFFESWNRGRWRDFRRHRLGLANRHWRSQHATDAGVPLDRAAFCREEQRRKWEGVRRCC